MAKDKHNPPQKPKPSFIKFSELQQAYLKEVRTRQFKEFQDIIKKIYEDMGIAEKVLNDSFRTYTLRKDCSGVDVLPQIPKK